MIDEFRFSNVARTASDHTTAWNNGTGAPFTADASTVVLYHFNEATGQAIGDSAGTAQNSTLGPTSAVEVSDPTWDNHRAVFEGSGLECRSYPYYDAKTGGLRFDAMLQALSEAPARSIVLLHACCHNPTGVDLSQSQWDALIPVLKERELIAFLEGFFGSGLSRRFSGRAGRGLGQGLHRGRGRYSKLGHCSV